MLAFTHKNVCARPSLKVYFIFVGVHILTYGTLHLGAVEMLQDEYHVSDEDKVDNSKMGIALSLMAAISGIVECLANPIWGHWSDIIGRRPVLVGCSLFASAAPLIIYFMPNLMGVLIAFAVGSLFHPHLLMMETCLYDLIPDEEKRRQYFGMLVALSAVSFIVAMILVSNILRPRLVWADIFLVIFGISLAQFLYITFFFPETNESVWIKITGHSYHQIRDDAMPMEDMSVCSEDDARKLEEDVKHASRNPFILMMSLRQESPALKMFVGIRLIETFCHAAWGASSPLLLEELYGWKIHELAPLAAITVVLMFISNMTLKIWDKCFTKQTLFTIALGSLILQRLLRALLMKDMPALFILQLAVSFPFGDIFQALTIALLTEVVNPNEKGRILGAIAAAHIVVQTVAQSIAPLIVGYFVSERAPIYLPTVVNIFLFFISFINLYLCFGIFNGGTNTNYQQFVSDDEEKRPFGNGNKL